MSIAMMLRYSLNQPAAADAIEKAVKNAIDVRGVMTTEMGGKATTEVMGDAVCAELRSLLVAA